MSPFKKFSGWIPEITFFHSSFEGGNELPGLFSVVPTGQKTLGNSFPAMNCRAIFSCPYGTENPFLSLIRVDGGELPGLFSVVPAGQKILSYP